MRNTAGEPSGDDTAAEDPLVELARIVHRTKQPGSSGSGGRVGNTDYFADLDDLSGDSEPTSARVEPSLSADPAPRPQPPQPPQAQVSAAPVRAPEPPKPVQPVSHEPSVSPYRIDTGARPPAAGNDAFAPSVTPGPRVEPRPQPDAFVRPQTARTEAPSDLSRPGDLPWPAGDRGATKVAHKAPAERVPPDFRSVRPDTDSRPAAPASQVRPQQVAAPKSPPAPPPPVQHPAETTADAGFEDELLGALRLSVDPVGRAPAAPAPRSEPEVPEVSSEPVFGRRESVPVERPQPAEAYAAAPVAEPTGFGKRPKINEDDFFAALGSGPAGSRTPATEPDRRDEIADDAAEFDTLFADLEFPEPTGRDRGGADRSRYDRNAEAPSDDASVIDEMTWPAAADAIQPQDEDAPPPPEGYDLDAVARAMQESDPSLADKGVLPPHPEREVRAAPHHGERSRKGLYAAAAVLAVAVFGAGAFFFVDGSSTSLPEGPPPIIAGLQEPLKIYPENAPQEDNQSSKLIYDRVDGTAETGRERLVLPETTEPAELPPAPEGVDSGASLAPGTPKRVRTLVVRPDGTIISAGDEAGTAASAPATAEQPAAPVTGTPAAPARSEPRVVSTTPVVATPPAAEDAAGAAATTPAPAVPTIVAATETIDVTQPAAASEDPATSAPVPGVLPRKKPDVPVQVARAPAATVAPVATQAPVATAPAAARQSGPLDLTQSQPSQPAPATTPAQASPASAGLAAGTWTVQLTSQRSQADAQGAYNGLQRRFPAILGGREAVIVSADLGDRGVFYRARVPAPTRDEAISLCESLKAAGGDCFIARN